MTVVSTNTTSAEPNLSVGLCVKLFGSNGSNSEFVTENIWFERINEKPYQLGSIRRYPNKIAVTVDLNSKASGFYRGSIRDLIRKYPDYASVLGFKLLDRDTYLIPDESTLNNLIDSFPNQNRISGLRVVLVPGKIIPDIIYAKYIVDGLFPIGLDSKIFIHDTSVHLFGALFLPKNILIKMQMRFSFLLMLLNDPILSRSTVFKKRVAKIIDNQVALFDSLTVDFSHILLNKQEKFSSGIYTSDFLGDLKQPFYFQEQKIPVRPMPETWNWGKDVNMVFRWRLQSILKQFPNQDLSVHMIISEFNDTLNKMDEH